VQVVELTSSSKSSGWWIRPVEPLPSFGFRLLELRISSRPNKWASSAVVALCEAPQQAQRAVVNNLFVSAGAGVGELPMQPIPYASTTIIQTSIPTTGRISATPKGGRSASTMFTSFCATSTEPTAKSLQVISSTFQHDLKFNSFEKARKGASARDRARISSRRGGRAYGCDVVIV
jgi:hypothetical protein